MRPLLLVLLGACHPTDDSGDLPAVDYAAPGPWSAARHTTSTTDTARGRALTIEAWYPTDTPSTATPSILDLVVDPADRAAYDALLTVAPAGCPALTTTATPDAPLAVGGPWPVLVMSHCYGCTRFSTVDVAEHLASYGFVVLAPDHAGDTLFDQLAGTGLALDTDTLALREGDITFALDEALAGRLPGALADAPLDADATGAFGHSFGAVTAGIVLQDRLVGRPGMFVGAPPDNPLLPGVDIATLTGPLFFETLAEDHSIGIAGNTLVEGNYEDAPGPAFHADLVDAGHWSPSDLVGLTDGFMPGCGDDTRESTGEAFTYMAPTEGRALTAALAAAFFADTVQGDARGADWLTGTAAVDARLTWESR